MSTIADSVIDRLASSLVGLTREQREQNDSFKEMFSDRKVWGTGETEADVRKRLRMRDRELKRAEEGAKAAAKYSMALEDLSDAVKSSSESTADMRAAALRTARALNRSAHLLDDTTREQLAAHIKLLESEEVLGDNLGDLANVAETVGKGQTKLYNTTAILRDQQDRTAKSIMRMRDNLDTAASAFFSFKTAVGLAAFGTKKLFGQLEYSLKYQVPLMDMMGEGILDTAAKYGVSVDTLMQVQNEYAGSILAATGGMGGMRGAASQLLGEFDAMRVKLHMVTGDYDDALKLAGTMRDTLSFAGVRHNTEQFVNVMNQPGGMIDSMRTLATVTNKSVEEIAAMNRQMMIDRDMRFTMLGLDERQRRNRLQEIMQHQTFLVSKGMEIEQAMESAAAFEKLNVQVSPKERYKQAAKIRAISGALGVEGGERFMSIMMKPTGQRTKEDEKFINQFATQMEQRMGKMYGGGIPSQMVGGAYSEAMSGPLYDSMIKGMSTAGLEAREIDEGTMKQIRLQENQLAGQQETALEIKRMAERLMAFSSDAGVYLAGGALAGIGAAVWHLGHSSAYLRAIAASKGLGGVGGPAPGTGKIGAVMRSTGLKVSGLAIASYGLDKVAEKVGEETREGIWATIASRAAGGASAGMLLGAPTGLGALVTGGVGALAGGAYGAYETWDKWGAGSNSAKSHITKSLELAEQNKNMVEQNKELNELVAIMKDQTKTAKEQLEASKTLTTALTTNTNVTNQNTNATGAKDPRRLPWGRGPISDDGGPSP